MTDDSTTADFETIFVGAGLAQLLALSKCATAKRFLNLEHLVRVRHCSPCEHCGAPVARVRLGSELHVVDCTRNELGNPYLAPRWDANLCAEHECEVRE